MKAVVVHRGARDAYQVARGLSESGLLEELVTDLHWSPDRSIGGLVDNWVPNRVRRALHTRWAGSNVSRQVSTCWFSGLSSLALSKLPGIPFDLRRQAVRWSDRCLGERAGAIATQRQAALLSYSYYGHSAFTRYKGTAPRILFQLHPHPRSVRQILERERTLYPECAASLNHEWELALPEADFERLAGEVLLAEHWIAASSFTKDTLIENGVPGERVHVVPYGTDLTSFRPDPARIPFHRDHRRLRLLFVGTIAQRKGIRYLVDAMHSLPAELVELTVCGRPVDDLSLFANTSSRIQVKTAIGQDELIEAYRHSDLFVFPSVAEGFGHVLLEAMASGLPVISTTRTAARDLVRPGVEGFVIQPGSAHALAESIRWFLENPARLAEMSRAARLRAEEFSWARFRKGVSEVVGDILQQSAANEKGRMAAYV
jgi:glycosyltransferase involved in cell wall biosynthesis